MSRPFETLSYGPRHTDPIVKLHDGEAAIREISDSVIASLGAGGIRSVRLCLETTNERQVEASRSLAPDELGIVRDRLNASFQRRFRACVRGKGMLEITEGPVNILRPRDIASSIKSYCGSLVSNPDTAFDVSQSFWNDHLCGARSHVNEAKRKNSGSLSPGQTLGILDGRSAEFLIQHVLERYLAPPHDPKDAQARLVDRRHMPKLPSGTAPTDTAYHLHFTTLYNCELNSLCKVGNRERRGGPMTESRRTVTEFDALATTGLDPDHPDSYSTLLVFDPTTVRQLPTKISGKHLKMSPFILDMEDRGIDVQVFHVLLHNGEEPLVSGFNMPRNTHLITLPLLGLVDRVARETAKQLGMQVA